MSAVLPAVEISEALRVPRLLVELPSRREIFFENLRDLISAPRLAPLELRSAPAAFWPDVFVKRGLPWNRFFQSSIYHVAAGALLVGLTHFFAMQPRVAPAPTFDHTQVVYYQASEYLPPIDTRRAISATPAKTDPELSRQPIISVPSEADNQQQTIVTPPKVKLKRDIAVPNMVAWSDTAQKPRLAIPPAPLTPAAEITRLAPKLEDAVATPPVDAQQFAHHRNSLALENSVAAPPSDLRASNAIPGLQPALIAPPNDLQDSTRSLGSMNVAPSPVIAPAPQLPVAAQRTVPGGRTGASGALPVVPPPPSLGASENSGTSFGTRGRVVALNVHPTVAAPADPPVGNRRGTFAATPEGHAGASGAPGSLASNASVANGSVGSAAHKENPGLPTGLYVGSANSKADAVAGDPSKAPTSTNPDLVASVHPPRVTTSHPAQPESTAKLTEAERAVFGNRRFYSVMLNMPNLNSAGGSWVIRFAELNHDSGPQDADAPASDLSQPMATRTVDPAYPTQLMRENVSGTVILYAVIHADGSVGNVRVLRSVDARLDRFASDAISQWKFDPATKNGEPVEVEATFKIPFRPARVGTNF
jgi:TonB family protein